MASLSELGEISKGLPSIMRAPGAVAPKGLQAGERFRANQMGRAASRHFASGGGQGNRIAGEGRELRMQSRSGSSGERGFGAKPAQWKKAETTADRLRASRGW